MKLKQSVKDAIQLAIVILVLVVITILGLQGMKESAKNYNENYLNQTKMTEMLATNQS